MVKSPDFDAKLRPYTKKFMVVKRYAKSQDFDAKLRPCTENSYGSQKVCKKVQILTQN